jgi:(1->4)-alpha-D-glucan 1-alpha-D-glucosylmutase
MSTILKPYGEEPLADLNADAAVDAILDAVADCIARQRLPEATYRVQFNHTFTFRNAREVAPYLAALGISDCYSSPYAKARSGSMHGYDIVDHNRLNPEVGTEEEFDEFVRDLHFHGISQVLDVVPNHMGVASDDNAWWIDVLENGPGSPYASFFDIDWMPLKPDLANKVLLPILGDQYGKVLEDQQLVLNFEEGAFFIRYYDRRFPISPRSSMLVLRHRLEELDRELAEGDPQRQEYHSILFSIGHLPARDETDAEKLAEGRREKEVIRRRLADLCAASPRLRAFIDENVRLFNGTRGDAASFDLLDALLLDQAYRLAYWRVAADEINFRRFFDINELAAICMERPEVFQATHGLILRLLEKGQIDGLRIDHPDGLYDPATYLRRLQEARFLQLCRLRGEGQTEAHETWESVESRLRERFLALSRSGPHSQLIKPLFVVVEKILEPGEQLPGEWPVHGTTGYDFLNLLNGLFVDRSQVRNFDRVYTRFIQQPLDFQELIYNCKKLIMQASMSSEISVLGHQLDRISEQNRRARDFTLSTLTEAMSEIIACFPVYRTYVNGKGVQERDRRYVELAVARARRRNPATSVSIFEFVRDILLLAFADRSDEEAYAAQKRFVGKFQQVTGPVMAKAVEDTAFYIYNRLVSLNEVGGNPEQFGNTPAAFHQQNLDRQAHWPESLLATSTHDTKRGEDVRARINVLSEIPEEWKVHLSRWSRWNKRLKRDVDGAPAPSRNDEYLLYQTLLGTWPFELMSNDGRSGDKAAVGNPPAALDRSSRSDREVYIGRIQNYMLKAAREAKVNTSWISPNEAFEKATREFVAGIIAESPRNLFLPDFTTLARQIADVGIWNSLSQTLLKLTSPGVPDIFQGTELFDFSLVDPDNRRPVDYANRKELLGALEKRMDGAVSELTSLASELVTTRTDSRIKLYLINKALNYRREHSGLFTTGQYVPLEGAGSRRDHLCAFLRKNTETMVVTVVPRLVARLTGLSGQPPLGATVWNDTRLVLPQEFAGARFTNLLTGEVFDVSADALLLAEVFRTFPVALLEKCAS